MTAEAFTKWGDVVGRRLQNKGAKGVEQGGAGRECLPLCWWGGTSEEGHLLNFSISKWRVLVYSVAL